MAAGDVTYSHPGGKENYSSFASGTVSADADTAVNVICGFKPNKITLYYKDTGATTNDVQIIWFTGMTAAYYWNILMSTGVMTLVTSGGPVAYDGTNEISDGFTIPAGLMDTDEDTIYWIADR